MKVVCTCGKMMWLHNQISIHIHHNPGHRIIVISAPELDRRTGFKIKSNYKHMQSPIVCGMEFGYGT